MPKTTSVSVFPLIVRSRVRRKTCSQPGQSDPRYPASDDVTSIVRFSTRPCPVSTSQARSTSASARAVWRGGKPSIRLSEGGRDVGTECRLVFLHGKDVVASPSITFAHTSRCVNMASPEMTLPVIDHELWI